MRGMVSASHLRARSANAATDSVARADAVSVMTAACVNAYDVSGESYWPETVMTLPLGGQVGRGGPAGWLTTVSSSNTPCGPGSEPPCPAMGHRWPATP